MNLGIEFIKNLKCKNYLKKFFYNLKDKFMNNSTDYDILIGEKLVQLFPNPENWLYLGLTYFSKNNIVKAIDTFKKSIDLDPKFADTYYYLGYMYLNNNEIDRAIENFEKAISVDANHNLALNELGRQFLRKKDFEKAIYFLKTSLEVNSDSNEVAWSLLGYCYESKGDQLNKNKTLNHDASFFIKSEKVYREDSTHYGNSNVVDYSKIEQIINDSNNSSLAVFKEELFKKLEQMNEDLINNFRDIILDEIEKRLKSYADNFNKLEEYLQKNLTSDWQKIKDSWSKYKRNKNIKEFAKNLFRILGRNALKIII